MSTSRGFNIIFDEEVIRSAIAGDETSFEEIYNQFYTPSLALAYKITGNKVAAQDVSQESFLIIFYKLEKYRGDGSFAGWVRKIVCNQSINYINKNKKETTAQESLLVNLESHDLFETEWCEARIDLRKLLMVLPQESRTVFVLHEIEGLTHKEVALLFNKTESFSKSILSRAYKLLKANALKYKLDNNVTELGKENALN